jgi:LytR cell envelope-related transcriptional attenuator
MTMLTPLGAGGAPYRRRRWWPRVLAVLLVLGLVAAAAGAWWWYRDRQAVEQLPAPVTSRSCTTPTPKVPEKLPEPSQVSVSVANGTDRAGLALDTADAFATRGFVVGDIGNTERPVDEGVALVRYRDQDLAAAVVVASYVPGAQLRPVQRVPDSDVALWIGPDFEGVVSAAEADPSSVAVPPGEPRCRKVR